MNSVVLDASALLAVLLVERGAAKVRELRSPWLISAVNLSEVVATAVERGLTVDSVMPVLSGLSMQVIPFDVDQAYLAASFRPMTRMLGLSLGDRACLALGLKTGCSVVTADKAWDACDVGVDIIQIR